MTVNLTIDGKQVTVPKGTSIMQAARENGIDIPGFCYHPRLDSFGACRVCMVHVTERGRTKDKFACAQPVSEGMEVVTKSDVIDKYASSVTEYLLAHHPLDCPICDKSGECELQDVAFRFKLSKGRIETVRRNEPSVKTNPILEFNHNRCILCGRCTRICGEVQGIAAIDFQGRGFNATVGPPGDRALDCEFCGQCLSVCPVGAIQDRVFNFKGRPWELAKTRTTCTYCSVGCTFSLNTKSGKIVRVTSDDEEGLNGGNLCSKGRFGFEFVHSKDRLHGPLIKRGGKLGAATWDEALTLIANKFKEVIDKNGVDSIGAIGSEKSANEDNYLFQKFVRVVLGSNYVDNMANIRAPYLNNAILDSIANGLSSESLESVVDADMVLLFGCDIVDEFPVGGNLVRKAIKKNNASLIIANSRNIKFKSVAKYECNLNYNFGAELSLITALLKVMIEDDLVNLSNIEQSVDNFGRLKEYLEESDLETLLNTAGVTKDQIIKFANLVSKSKKRFVFIGKEVLSSPCGEDNLNLIVNLAYFFDYGTGDSYGNNGNTNLFFPREHNNSQGVNDMGVVPGYLPGYQNYASQDNKDKFAVSWAKSSGVDSLTLPEKLPINNGSLFDHAIQGSLKAMYIMGENPVLTHVDGREAREALTKLNFLVVQDSFLTETACMADVVLPSVTFAEKSGTFNNIGRLAQKINKAVEPVGDSKPDWKILCELAGKMGFTFNYSDEASIMDEIKELAPLYNNIKYEELDKQGASWTDNLEQPSRFEFSVPKSDQTLTDNLVAKFPYALTTGNIMFHLGTYSHKSKALNDIYPECRVEINPEDADDQSLNDGDMVEVTAPNSELRLKVKISKKSPKGVVFIPSNYDSIPVNLLVDRNCSPRVKLIKVVK